MSIADSLKYASGDASEVENKVDAALFVAFCAVVTPFVCNGELTPHPGEHVHHFNFCREQWDMWKDGVRDVRIHGATISAMETLLDHSQDRFHHGL